ncbi:hypothetical protein [Streptomyces sp. H27-C3]|uniref:hypothetical protein n=1 Tax=Streptomyces sp. H27-C3 TaxID=3046305 RepID=UPI0024BA11DA|nr:hypothetical protein [Streptomyces sp. H27-C3]MDJ0463530.1 hypothetical protein [Streptomyces sp. H27-C3]
MGSETIVETIVSEAPQVQHRRLVAQQVRDVRRDEHLIVEREHPETAPIGSIAYPPCQCAWCTAPALET